MFALQASGHVLLENDERRKKKINSLSDLTIYSATRDICVLNRAFPATINRRPCLHENFVPIKHFTFVKIHDVDILSMIKINKIISKIKRYFTRNIMSVLVITAPRKYF